MPPEPTGRIAILLAAYNGARFLPDQLESYANQTHTAWDLYVSDDGSTDETRAIVEAFARRMAPSGHRVEITTGPCRGTSVANFLTLLSAPRDAQWIALSDQDDQWLPDKLARAVAALAAAEDDRPRLYCSRTWIADDALQIKHGSRAPTRPASFRNAMVQNIAAGNTIVLNRKAADLARMAAPHALPVDALPAHDWWLYQLVTGTGGAVIVDPDPTLLYRQHDGNQIGANHGVSAGWWRVTFLLKGGYRLWNDANIAALRPVAEHFTPENRAALMRFAALRDRAVFARLWGLARLGIHRQTRSSQVLLWLAALLGRL